MAGKVLQYNRTLTILDLAFNPLRDELITILADTALRSTTTTIRKLSLLAIDMTDVGVTAIGNALKYNRSLRLLELNKNKFTGTGVIALGEGLKYNTTLTQLEMSDHLFYENIILALRPQDIDFNYLATFFIAMEYNTSLQYLGIFEPHFDYEHHMPPVIIQRIVQSLNDYNDTLIDLFRGMKSAVPNIIRDLIQQACKGQRAAHKKRGHERRDIYNWLLLL
jgi:hypothetical protein